jgi:hypothetical protein
VAVVVVKVLLRLMETVALEVHSLALTMQAVVEQAALQVMSEVAALVAVALVV